MTKLESSEARVGLPPLVRAWIDHLALGFRDSGLFQDEPPAARG